MSLAVNASVVTSGRGVLSTSIPSGVNYLNYSDRPAYYEQWIAYSNLDADDYRLTLTLPALDWSTYVTGITGGTLTLEATLFDNHWEGNYRTVTIKTNRVDGPGGSGSKDINLRAGPPSTWVGELSNQLADGDINCRLRMWISDITDDGSSRTDADVAPDAVVFDANTNYLPYAFADGGLTEDELDAFGHSSNGYQWTVTLLRINN